METQSGLTARQAHTQNGLSVTEKLSSQDLVLMRMLDLAAQITRQEVMPGEIRFWSETFRKECPEMLEWAFSEYLRTAQFFPKPGDIEALLERRRAAVLNHYKPIDRAAVATEQATPEWEEVTRQARETLARIAGKGALDSASLFSCFQVSGLR